MFNYPFTLDDIIFIPIDYILTLYKYESSKTKTLINTLIHEKIHIAQRTNEFEWEQFIKQNNKWEKILPNNIEFNLIDTNIKLNRDLLEKEQIFILNPDSTYNNFNYIWIGNENENENKNENLDELNSKYYIHYIYDKKTNKIEKKYFQIDIKKFKLVPIVLNSNIDYPNEEHPYEDYAYKIANELVKNL